MKKFILLSSLAISSIAHPVSYTMDLTVSYDENTKKAEVHCISSSKNKCGLYSINLLDENENIIKTKRFPFLKKSTKVRIDKKPHKMVFFLRKTPEHTYIKIFE